MQNTSSAILVASSPPSFFSPWNIRWFSRRFRVLDQCPVSGTLQRGCGFGLGVRLLLVLACVGDDQGERNVGNAGVFAAHAQSPDPGRGGPAAELGL